MSRRLGNKKPLPESRLRRKIGDSAKPLRNSDSKSQIWKDA
jgi:hypothetical protein